ncbi:hypothetical protein D0Y50_02390 [Salinimonas sediminis]|uniref:Uncharacterized protein n=1 Tax=Salinimonas sediminis TaxID=2303538 RepID=A0A346NIF8_9ALTE|nr:hypothetical protein D0Y50_02390 [Salinimonas sediminis]
MCTLRLLIVRLTKVRLANNTRKSLLAVNPTKAFGMLENIGGFAYAFAIGQYRYSKPSWARRLKKKRKSA